MRVLVTGASGFIGSALVPLLTTGGHAVTRLVRRGATPGQAGVRETAEARGTAEIRWDPAAGTIDRVGLEGHDAVVHLAGENVAGWRWTAEKKARIRASRVEGTQLLCKALAGLERPPGVLVSASAIGYYGDRGDEVLTEASAPGTGFLASVAREWEAAAEPARRRGLRVVHPRIGVVLGPAGGALAKMLPPFRMGLGGKLGAGTQWISWIALGDLLGVLEHMLVTETLEGPVNAVAPNPVTNAEFTRTLGRVLGRPTVFGMPTAAVRAMFGEMADEMLLASTRVVPARLLASGYRFQRPDLDGALRHFLGRPAGR
jgi:uncharacterized protein (TIGR01777 family)